MKKTALLLALAFAAQAYAQQASATVIDFEALAHADGDAASYAADYRYVEKGYSVANLTPGFGFSSWGTGSAYFTGSTALSNDNDGGISQLSLLSGGLFALYAIDLSALYPGLSSDPVSVTFTGVKSDASLVTQSFSVAGSGTQTYSFGSEFSNLTALSWSNDAMYHQFDNIQVAELPEPATAALLFSSLGLLAFSRRRSRRS